jgi:hypothetical protein
MTPRTSATAKKFLLALESGGRAGAPTTVEEARARQKQEWLEDLGALRDRIREWLAPIEKANRATVADESFTVTEPDLGTYEAPGLAVSLLVGDEPRRVLLRPRGVMIVGVVGHRSPPTGPRGRVDLECGVARQILLRFPHPRGARWMWFAKGERELDESAFFDILADITALPVT